jgi:hypothetical protein
VSEVTAAAALSLHGWLLEALEGLSRLACLGTISQAHLAIYAATLKFPREKLAKPDYAKIADELSQIRKMLSSLLRKVNVDRKG